MENKKKKKQNICRRISFHPFSESNRHTKNNKWKKKIYIVITNYKIWIEIFTVSYWNYSIDYGFNNKKLFMITRSPNEYVKFTEF